MTTSHRSFAICSGFVIVHELERITYKLAVLAYQCLRRLAPTYLADALQPVAQIHGRQRLRSSSTSALAVVSTINTVLYDLWPSFQVATAQTGKSLPSEVTSSETVQVFKSDHKTHLFPSSLSSSWLLWSDWSAFVIFHSKLYVYLYVYEYD